MASNDINYMYGDGPYATSDRRNHQQSSLIRRIEESDSDALKTFVKSRHTQTAFSSLERKNYRQERSKM